MPDVAANVMLPESPSDATAAVANVTVPADFWTDAILRRRPLPGFAPFDRVAMFTTRPGVSWSHGTLDVPTSTTSEPVPVAEATLQISASPPPCRKSFSTRATLR
jgi:hypothetical protein